MNWRSPLFGICANAAMGQKLSLTGTRYSEIVSTCPSLIYIETEAFPYLRKQFSTNR